MPPRAINRHRRLRRLAPRRLGAQKGRPAGSRPPAGAPGRHLVIPPPRRPGRAGGRGSIKIHSCQRLARSREKGRAPPPRDGPRLFARRHCPCGALSTKLTDDHERNSIAETASLGSTDQRRSSIAHNRLEHRRNGQGVGVGHALFHSGAAVRVRSGRLRRPSGDGASERSRARHGAGQLLPYGSAESFPAGPACLPFPLPARAPAARASASP
jgi:hypothetical protein